MSVSEEITKLEAVLNESATSVAVDGVSVAFDLDAARRRLEELKRQQDPSRRPRIAGINLGGAW